MPFETEEVEDGTGLTTALVYEQPEDAAAWLVARGLTAFDAAEGSDDSAQMVLLLNATEAAEDAVRKRLRGAPVTENQGLLFPASGAYDATGRLMTEDELPRRYIQGIRLLAEVLASGKPIYPLASAAGIQEESTRRGKIVYRAGSQSDLAAAQPEAWARISTVIPRL